MLNSGGKIRFRSKFLFYSQFMSYCITSTVGVETDWWLCSTVAISDFMDLTSSFRQLISLETKKLVATSLETGGLHWVAGCVLATSGEGV